MADIDRIIEQLLGDRRISEGAAFSSRTFSDQPIIQRGSDFKRRQDERRQRTKEREQRIAERESKRAAERTAKRATEREAARTVRREETRTPQPTPDLTSQQPRHEERPDSQKGSFFHMPSILKRQKRPEGQGAYRQRTPEETRLRRQLPTEEEALREYRRRQRETIRHRDGSRGMSGARIVFREDENGDALGYVNESGQSVHDTWGNLVPSFDPRFTDPFSVEVPQAIREMRKLEGGGVPAELAYGSNSSASLFYRQARLMEDYEDDFPPASVGFNQYYPTYAAMSDRQLRSYFGWRTRVRQGDVGTAPLSYAFVYVYELLCGIGTTPGAQGLRDLRAFGSAYREANGYDGDRLQNYLYRWEFDYIVYHGLTAELGHRAADEAGMAVLTLLSAEHAQLRAAGKEPRIPNPATDGNAPSTSEVFAALSEASSYHIGTSRLTKDEPELLEQVATDIFANLVMHCSKRRKTDYVEGLFGYATNIPWTMFSGAIFFEEEPHPDCRVQASAIESYTCTDGRWRHQTACEVTKRSTELGLYMHEVDFELRKQLDYAYPLKQRNVPKYVERMVQKAVETRLKERTDAQEARRKAEEEAERRRIKIDLSKLGDIRAAAALTQEALLTDEERGLDVVAEAPGRPTVEEDRQTRRVDQAEASMSAMEPDHAPQAEPARATRQPSMERPEATDQPPLAQPPELQTPVVPRVAPSQGPTAPTQPATPPAATSDYGLSDLELRVLRGIMEGAPMAELLGPTDPFVSVVGDSINEKLFDLVGDAVIEFDGDDPRIIEDYLEDVREVLQP